MLYTIPDYYKEFSCTADQCEDTCCAGWQIVVDKKSLRKYRRVKGPYLATMLRRIDWIHGTFRQNDDKRCAFLKEDNLCDMYCNLGSESLCKTCRLYPRHIEEFEGVREITLSVSCPEVAKILMNRTQKTAFLSVEKDGEEEYEDFDPFLYSMLLDVRDAMLNVLQDRSLSVEVRAGLVYGLARDAQIRVNHQELFACQEVIEKYQKESAKRFVENQIQKNRQELGELYYFYQNTFRKLHELELLKEDWYVLLRETEHRLYENGPEAYDAISKEFFAWTKEYNPMWEIQKEQLLVYFIFTYLCGAVYDGHVLKKAQMAIVSVNLLEELLKVRWLRNEKMFDTEDVTELVYRYSREVEHSDINLKRMENMMPAEHGLYC